MVNKAIPDSAVRSGGSQLSPGQSAAEVAAGYIFPSGARLGATEGWCAIRDAYLKVDFGSPHIICAISTQGLSNDIVDAYVQEYTIELALKDFNGEYYKENGTIRVCYFTYFLVTFYIPPGRGERRLLAWF